MINKTYCWKAVTINDRCPALLLVMIVFSWAVMFNVIGRQHCPAKIMNVFIILQLTIINVSRFIVKVLKRNQFVEVKFKGKNSFEDIDTKRYIKLPDVPYKLSFKLLCMDSQVDSPNLTSLLFGRDKGFFFFFF